jgi:hypothetical protein
MAQMLKSPNVAREVHRRAEQIAGLAKDFAPVVSGDYRNSIHVEDDQTDRAVSLVIVGVDYGLEVEALHAPLGRAANAGAES